jgi:hypothetical protein
MAALHKFNRKLHSTRFKRASGALSGVALATFLVWAIAGEPGLIIASLVVPLGCISYLYC